MIDGLVLDGSKVGWYPDRIAAWERGELIAPITIDCAMTRACNAACNFCVFPDSMILMADGTRKRMDAIRAGDVVVSFESGKAVASVVAAQWQTSPMQRGLRLTTIHGSLKCTPSHLILTDDGWCPAGLIKRGDYVWAIIKQTEDGNEQSYVDAWGRGKGGADEAKTVWEGLLQKTLAAHCRRGKEWQAHSIDGRTQGGQRSNEAKQSHEKEGYCRQGSQELHAREADSFIGKNEGDMEGRSNYARNVPWPRQCKASQQDGENADTPALRLRRPLRGERHVLAPRNGQWYLQESGFHIRKRAQETSPSSSWGVLASRRVRGSHRACRLQEGGMESIGPMGAQVIPMDASEYRVCDGIVVEKVQIISIEEAGNSAVYDLECAPYHNFVADGVVVHNCYASLQANAGFKISREHFFAFLEDAAEIGVKGVSYISDGESTVVPWYADAVEYGAKLGLAVGAGSNGILLVKSILERILPHLSYLRINFSAGERKRYAEIMGVKQECFGIVIQNIKDAMEIVRRDGLACTVNMQLVCDPKDGDQILPFARLAKELQPSYSIIKHCADNKEGTLGVDYGAYEKINGDLKQAEAMGTVVKWSRIVNEGKREYAKCFGPPFIMQVSGSGLVAPCGFLFNEKYKTFHIGNITEKRFKDIWMSERYMDVMRYLASDHFDPRQRCGPNCLQDRTNDFLFKHQAGQVQLPTGEAPKHLEFI